MDEKILLKKSDELIKIAEELVSNIKLSYVAGGQIQAQDVARVEKLYDISVDIREAAQG
jgi:hypothetical protein